MERQSPSLELLHENLAIAVTYAIDIMHECVAAQEAAKQYMKDRGETTTPVFGVPQETIDMALGLSIAYLSIWTHVTEMQHLNGEHLKDYWTALLEKCTDERRADMHTALTNFINSHRGHRGKARKT